MSKHGPTVYVFMDESGDTGGKLDKGASPYFIVVWVETTNPEALREAIRNLRTALSLPKTFEFRYHDTHAPRVRIAFFKLLRSLNMRVRAALVDKTRLPKDFKHYGRDALYPFVVGALVLHAPADELQDAILVLDGKHGVQTDDLLAKLRRHLTRLCREQQRARVFEKLVACGAKSEDGLQVADMIAGALSERFERGKSDYDTYIKLEVISKMVDWGSNLIWERANGTDRRTMGSRRALVT
jgi:hypothetical protein